MIRAVIDTNVLVSGLLSPSGNEALIVLAVHQRLVHACFSDDILAEYAEVLARPKFSFEPDDIAAMLAMFRDGGELVAPDGSARVSPDPPVLPDRATPSFYIAPWPRRPSTSSPATNDIFPRMSAAR